MAGEGKEGKVVDGAERGLNIKKGPSRLHN